MIFVEKDTKRFLLHAVLACVLFGVGFLLYVPTYEYGFTLDDELVLERNNKIRDFDGNYMQFFTESLYAGSSLGEQNKGEYRPVFKAFMALNYRLAGSRFDPAAFHAINLILYGLCVALFFCFLLQIIPASGSYGVWIAFSGAMLFAVFPSHIETVANIKHREEMLAFGFGLLSWLLFIKGENPAGSRTIHFKLMGVISFFFAILCKENAILFFPCMLLWNRITQNQERNWLKNLPSFVYILPICIVLYLVLRIEALGSLTLGGEARTFFQTWDDPITRALVSAGIFAKYYLWDQLIVLKLNPALSGYYFIMAGRFPMIVEVLLLFILVTALGYSAFRVIKNRSSLLFWPLAFFILSFFIIHIVPINTAGAFRLMFSPSLALCIFVVFSVKAGAEYLARKRGMSRKHTLQLILGVLGIFILLYGGAILIKMPMWQSDITLFSYSVKAESRNPYAHFTLGQLYERSGDTAGKYRHYQTALDLYRTRIDELRYYDERNLDYFSIAATEIAYRDYPKWPKSSLELADIGIRLFRRLEELRGGKFDTNIAGPYYAKALAQRQLGQLEQSLATCHEGLQLTPHQGLSQLAQNLELELQKDAVNTTEFPSVSGAQNQ